MARTIDDLLELSRIELGEEPRLDVVDVVAVVDEAVDRTRQLAEARDIAVDALELPSGVPRRRRPPPAGVRAGQPARERR